MMLMIFVIVIFVMVIVVMLFFVFALHAFNEFFFLNGITQLIHEVDNDHVLVDCFFERVFYPLVRLAADINEEVTG